MQNQDERASSLPNLKETQPADTHPVRHPYSLPLSRVRAGRALTRTRLRERKIFKPSTNNPTLNQPSISLQTSQPPSSLGGHAEATRQERHSKRPHHRPSQEQGRRKADSQAGSLPVWPSMDLSPPKPLPEEALCVTDGLGHRASFSVLAKRVPSACWWSFWACWCCLGGGSSGPLRDPSSPPRSLRLVQIMLSGLL